MKNTTMYAVENDDDDGNDNDDDDEEKKQKWRGIYVYLCSFSTKDYAGIYVYGHSHPELTRSS